jgi:hypothetical protein
MRERGLSVGHVTIFRMRKGRVKRLDGRDAVGHAKFVERLFSWEPVSIMSFLLLLVAQKVHRVLI